MHLGILTGGGDVPGLNPAIKAVVNEAFARDWRVTGFRRGWAGCPSACSVSIVVDLTPEPVPGSNGEFGVFRSPLNGREQDRLQSVPAARLFPGPVACRRARCAGGCAADYAR